MEFYYKGKLLRASSNNYKFAVISERGNKVTCFSCHETEFGARSALKNEKRDQERTYKSSCEFFADRNNETLWKDFYDCPMPTLKEYKASYKPVEYKIVSLEVK